jgi:hypothetical protein
MLCRVTCDSLEHFQAYIYTYLGGCFPVQGGTLWEKCQRQVHTTNEEGTTS